VVASRLGRSILWPLTSAMTNLEKRTVRRGRRPRPEWGEC